MAMAGMQTVRDDLRDVPQRPFDQVLMESGVHRLPVTSCWTAGGDRAGTGPPYGWGTGRYSSVPRTAGDAEPGKRPGLPR